MMCIQTKHLSLYIHVCAGACVGRVTPRAYGVHKMVYRVLLYYSLPLSLGKPVSLSLEFDSSKTLVGLCFGALPISFPSYGSALDGCCEVSSGPHAHSVSTLTHYAPSLTFPPVSELLI